MTPKMMIDSILQLSDDVDDLANYRHYLDSRTAEDLADILERKRYYKTPRYQRDINREIALLDKGGMFDVGKMAPINALD